MVEKTPTQAIDLSALRADPEATETKYIHGIPFDFRTRMPAKVFVDLELDPTKNERWEFDLQHVVVKSPVLTFEEYDGMDANTKSEIVVECLNIGGLTTVPTFR
jgi:hypothetical protein